MKIVTTRSTLKGRTDVNDSNFSAEQWQMIAGIFAKEARDLRAVREEMFNRSERISGLIKERNALLEDVNRLKRENRKLRKAIKESNQ